MDIMPMIEYFEEKRREDPRANRPLISIYESLLWDLEPDEDPSSYASIQYRLGNAYHSLEEGNSTLNLLRVIDCYLEASQYWTPETAPLDYASVMYSLGKAYSAWPIGDPSRNRARAIECYQEALRFCTLETAPLIYTWTQYTLGCIYDELPGDRPTNLAKAISCYKEALRYWTPETAPSWYATTQNKLGRAYRHLWVCDRTTDLSQAITCYQEALRIWTAENAPDKYAEVQNNLGNIYLAIHSDDETANLKKAMAYYQEALRIWTLECAPENYAGLQYNLGHIYYRISKESDAIRLEQAISCYREALRFLDEEEICLAYAYAQYNLGNALQQEPTDNDEAKQKKAIECYKEALRFLNGEDDPFNYAQLHNTMGNIYSELSKDNHEDYLLKAVESYQEALRFLPAETAPRDYAAVQLNLGNTYQLLADHHEANLQKAIECYKEALRFLDSERDGVDYAQAQVGLGLAYSDLSSGNRAVHLQEAITCYQRALEFWTLETAPDKYASTQLLLGNLYRQLPVGNRLHKHTKAIDCYQEALKVWTAETNPHDYASVQINLGLSYSELRAKNNPSHLTQAINCFGAALRIFTPETFPQGYARAQTGIANAYIKLTTGDPHEHLMKAMDCIHNALSVLTAEKYPTEYAGAHHLLGVVYTALLAGNRNENLTQAISHLQEASGFLTPENSPEGYANVQYSLGVAYGQLPTGDRIANLQQSIACLEEAAHFFTSETDPDGYAGIQNNLGVAYSDLAELSASNHTAYLEKAILHFKEALNFRTAETTPLEYANLQNNLGNAYYRLWRIDENIQTHEDVRKAMQVIAYFLQALSVLDPQLYPLNYAGTLLNLGRVYAQLQGHFGVFLFQAVDCFEKALQYLNPQTSPFDYASTLNNLGRAHFDLTRTDFALLSADDRQNALSRALQYYLEALQLLSPEVSPIDCRMTNRNLAQLYIDQGEWQKALQAYRAATDAGEIIYRAGLSAASKSSAMVENTALYRQATYAAACCEAPEEALLILERGKTRLLAEALHLRVSRPANVPDEVWNAFEQAGTAMRRTVTQEESLITLNEARNITQAYALRQQNAQKANADLKNAIEEVRKYAPGFLQDIDLSLIRDLLPDEHTAIVDFCVTDQVTLGFIVQRNEQKIQMLWIPSFTRSILQNLVFGENGWIEVTKHLSKETRTSTDIEIWKKTISDILTALGEQLLVPALAQVPSSIKNIIFLPSAELFLFPLHAVPLSKDGQELVRDRYQVSYAPSLEVLASVKARAAQVASAHLYAVINPESDPALLFGDAESQALATCFEQYLIDRGKVGTKEHIIATLPGWSYAHFSCHGKYLWNDPGNSGLQLADGRLTLSELQRSEIDLSAVRSVTLSACETGITDVIQGSAEEYVGIPAGFLMAGVPCVVSSLWAVPGPSTALLMQRFYLNHLRNDMSIAEALRAAQQWVRTLSFEEALAYIEQYYSAAREKKEQELLFKFMRFYRLQTGKPQGPFVHPFDWAAFTCTGL